MRWMAVAAAVVWMVGTGPSARAADKDTDRIVGGVISGLLGTPQQPADAAYLATERERLASALQRGDYATSRQGEPIDLVILGVPLTRTDHVYTAKPIPAGQTSSGFPSR